MPQLGFGTFQAARGHDGGGVGRAGGGRVRTPCRSSGLTRVPHEDDMTLELICELNLALIPDEPLANRHIALSKEMATRYPPLIELNGVRPRLAFAPHLTLYQVPIRVQDMPSLCAGLAAVTAASSPLSLAATEFASNHEEGSFEVRYEPTSDLMELQDAVIAAANPLRGNLLLERDPAGHELTDLIHEPGTKGDNIRATGFDAVGEPAGGGLFQPHVTINWFELGTAVASNDDRWPISDFNGLFPAIGIYLLGPYGTCAQRMAMLEL
jgi:hypothetical protein